jgi:hypothetical protein
MSRNSAGTVVEPTSSYDTRPSSLNPNLLRSFLTFQLFLIDPFEEVVFFLPSQVLAMTHTQMNL